VIEPNLGFAVSIELLKPLVEKPNPIPMTRWSSAACRWQRSA
jgi:hypothetical protein